MAMKIALTSQAITDHITLLRLEENTGGDEPPKA